ncbi:MAG: HNH endonuclease [Nitrosotalea sp.]
MSIFSGNKKTRKRLVRPTKIQVARGQNFMCYGCNLQIQSEDAYDVYHKDGNPSNNNIENLKVVHVKCHRGINHKKKNAN